jgi:hypothetical protein
MRENILENLKAKFPHHAPALLSSFIYVLVGFGLYDKDKLAFVFLFLVFLTSLFYHSHPENIFFRIGDWLASFTFVFYIINIVYLYEFSFNIFAILGFFCVTFWIISEVAYYNKFNQIFNVSHTLWHILSAITVFMVIFSVR